MDPHARAARRCLPVWHHPPAAMHLLRPHAFVQPVTSRSAFSKAGIRDVETSSWSRPAAMCAASRPRQASPSSPLGTQAAASTKFPAPWFGSLNHRSAVAVLPPRGAAWEQLQAMRRECRAVGVSRWPPHCNLVYPFLPAHLVDRGSDIPQLRKIASAISKLPPFEVRLQQCDIFRHQRSVTLILCPETRRFDKRGDDGTSVGQLWRDNRSPRNLLCALYAAVERASPEVAAQMRQSFVPHVSVARFDSEDVAQAWKARLERDLAQRPIRFDVQAAHIILRRTDEPFQSMWDIPLRGAPAEICSGIGGLGETLLPSQLEPYEHPPLRDLFPLEYPVASDLPRRKWPLVVFGRPLNSYRRRRLPWYR